jgi:hypothetical protein
MELDLYSNFVLVYKLQNCMLLVLICKIYRLKSLYLQTKIQWLETSYCPFYFISLIITMYILIKRNKIAIIIQI